MDVEVRMTHLHPRDFRTRLLERPVAWLPLGTFEWHGFHLPLGFDGVKAEGLCVRAARTLGGIVMPAMFYGDHRGYLQEAAEPRHDHRVQLCAELGGEADRHAAHGTREEAFSALDAHVDLLLRTFWAIRAYGFTRVVAVAGHYPLMVGLMTAVSRFHTAQTACRVIAGTDVDLSGVAGGDHAARYETSELLVLNPELVRLEELPDGEPLGVGGVDPREANVALGEEIASKFIEALKAEVGAAPPMPRFDSVDEDGMQPTWQRPDPPGGRMANLFRDPRNQEAGAELGHPGPIGGTVIPNI